MGQIKIPTIITGPDQIEVEMVRADHNETRNIFRVFFEVFLAFASMLGGVILSIDKPTAIHWIFLGFVSIGTIVFLLITIFYKRNKKS